jgi:putative PIG3 family NAD(P)H quinone oxidoreductase
MKAIEISTFGGPEALSLVDRPVPEPACGEILIRGRAAGVARADLLQRQGKYPPPPGASDIPGLDVAGVVERAGDGVTAFSVGDPVCAILTGGGYAEYCVVPAQQALPKPENWTMTEAASLPENLFTAFDNLVTRAALRRSEAVLIHGGSSGVGTMAIMLASLFDATIIVTAGSVEKCQACLHLGAHHAINYKAADFEAEVKEITQGRGVDVILDMVGGDYLGRNINSLATEGRLAIIATQRGHIAPLDITALMKKRGRISASAMRARTPAAKALVAEALASQIWPLLPHKSAIRPVIDSVFALQDASEAHRRLESGLVIGKVVLETGSSLQRPGR